MIRSFLSLSALCGCFAGLPLMGQSDLDLLQSQLIEAASDAESDFDSVFAEAESGGVEEGKLFQARLIHAMNTQDYLNLLALSDDIPEHMASFDIGFDPQGEGDFVFSSPHEVMGLYHTLKAVVAYQDGDMATFETHYKEAAWEWPAWEQVFQLSSFVFKERTDELMRDYMANMTVSLDLELRDLDGNATTLGALMEGKKAVLLDFWASWCGPCMSLMPELQKKSDLFGPQGIHVIAVNTDEEEPLIKAAQVKESREMDMPWLSEMDGAPLSQLLNIDSIPRMVLISPDGKVLYNDHPADPRLYEVLATLGVEGHVE